MVIQKKWVSKHNLEKKIAQELNVLERVSQNKISLISVSTVAKISTMMKIIDQIVNFESVGRE